MARYVDTDDFDAVCDARAQLFDDGNGAFSSTLFNRAADLASAGARAFGENAGYDFGTATSSDNDTIKLVALAFLIRMAFGRRGRRVPEHLEAIFAELPDAVRTGEMPIPDLSADSADSVGGVASTDRSSTSSTGRPPIFKDLSKVR